MILGLELLDTSNNAYSSDGFHAVAVTGYNLELEKETSKYRSSNLNILASKINKLYVHDDQIGPFARMEFDNKKLFDSDGNEIDSLSTSWSGRDDIIGSIRAVPDLILIPLYHKIRIPFSMVRKIIDSFNEQIISYNKRIQIFEDELIWDIYLISVNKLKLELRDEKNLAKGKMTDILTKSMPRYLWRATAIYDGENLCDYLFDATDIEQGPLFICPVEYDSKFATFISVSLQRLYQLVC